jgi:hypothetical protein
MRKLVQSPGLSHQQTSAPPTAVAA